MQGNHTSRNGSVNPLRFAPIIYDLSEDRRLLAVDVRVAISILKWLGNNATGWTCNRKLAVQSCCSMRTVQYAIRRMEAAGYFRCGPTEGNSTHRLITAVWRLDTPATDCTGAMQPVAGGAMQPVACNIDYLNETDYLEEPPPSVSPILQNGSLGNRPPETTLGASTHASGDADVVEQARIALEALVAHPVGRAKMKLVNAAARLTIRLTLDHRGSWKRHCKIGNAIATGKLSTEMFWAAYDAAMLKADKVDDPDPLNDFAAYFTEALNLKWAGTDNAGQDQAFEEETAERWANGEF